MSLVCGSGSLISVECIVHTQFLFSIFVINCRSTSNNNMGIIIIIREKEQNYDCVVAFKSILKWDIYRYTIDVTTAIESKRESNASYMDELKWKAMYWNCLFLFDDIWSTWASIQAVNAYYMVRHYSYGLINITKLFVLLSLPLLWCLFITYGDKIQI